MRAGSMRKSMIMCEGRGYSRRETIRFGPVGSLLKLTYPRRLDKIKSYWMNNKRAPGQTKEEDHEKENRGKD